MRQRYAKMLVYAIAISAILLALIFAFVKPAVV
jgi:hypothetical protein